MNVRENPELSKVIITFVEVEDISDVFPQKYHVYYWEKGCKPDNYWKSYAYGWHAECPAGIGIADDAWDACKIALDEMFMVE